MTAIPIPPPPIVGPGIPDTPTAIRPFPTDAAKAVWHDYQNFVVHGWRSAINFAENAINVGGQVVGAAVDAGSSYVVTALGSAINDAVTYTDAVRDYAAEALSSVGNFALNAIYGLEDEIAFLSAFVGGVVLDDIRGIDDAIRNIETIVPRAIDALNDQIRTWVIDDIASPLLREVAGVERYVGAALGDVVDTLRGEIADAIHSEALRRAAAIAGLTAAVAGLLDWVDTCGEPMCDTIGPKTDLAKLLKLLNAAGTLAFLLALAELTEPQLERLASEVVALASGSADDFIHAFFVEDESIGHALADTIAGAL